MMPRQFRVLYRGFLARTIDLEALSAGGEIQTLLAQFAAMLAALSFVLMVYLVPRYGTSPFPHARLMTLAWLDEEFLIGTTMVVAGMFSVLAWNTVLPDRRDALVLGVLPVSPWTICRAKLGALGTSLAVYVVAVNAFTGIAYPVALSTGGIVGFLRALAAYWITMAAAGAFLCAALVALQGIALQTLSYRLFQRVSSFLQLAAFFVILGAYFLKPPLATVVGLTSPAHRGWVEWLPTYWFLGLFQTLNGPMHPAFPPLARRAIAALVIALAEAALSYMLAFRRGLRRIVEQPEIAPANANRGLAALTRALVGLLPGSIDRAIVLFTGRTIARSRQHRLILAIYGGIALAISMAYLKSYLYGSAKVWGDAEVSLLAPGVVTIVFAAIGARAVFALPMSLPANWIFRVTAVQPPALYFSAARKALGATAALPVWLACAAVYLSLWRGSAAWKHVLVLGLVGAIFVFTSMRRFRKIPFACSYLPGKANLTVRLGMYGILFLFLCDTGVRIEAGALSSPYGFAILAAILAATALLVSRRKPRGPLQFEELPANEFLSLDLESPSAEPPGTLPPEPRPPLQLRLDQIPRDLYLGFRALAQRPAFSAAAIALIATGIGGNTAIYSMIHGVMTRPAPGVRAERLVSFGVTVNGQPEQPEGSYLEYLEYSTNSQTVRPLAASRFSFFTLALPQSSYELRGERVTQDYFETLGVRIARGRSFSAAEMRGEGRLAAVIADHVWRNQFQADSGIIGREVELNGCPATIIGVTAPGFRGSRFAPNYEVGVPLEAYERLCARERELADPRMASLDIVGRLAPRATLRQARAEFAGFGRLLQDAYPGVQRGRMPQLAEYSASAFSQMQTARAKLFMRGLEAIGILTLLIVCANVANLMLARAVARQREIAVRRALGASRACIMRLLLSEGLALSLVAATAAWIFARWATGAVVKLTPPLSSGAHIEPNLTPDAAVAAYAVALAALSALAFTAAPAIRAWRQDVLPWLKAGEQGSAPGRAALANLLAGAQVALCIVLLTAAGLAMRSLYLIGASDLHFSKDHLLLVNIDTAGAAAGERPNIALLERLRQRLAAIPGVTTVTYGSSVPPANFGGWGAAAQAQGSAQRITAAGMDAGPRYLETLGIALVAGRAISEDDVLAARPVAVVTRHLADALWPRQSPLGRTLLVEGARFETIGVTENAAMAAMQDATSNYIWLPERPRGSSPGRRVLYLRYAGAAVAIGGAAHAAIREIDPRIPVSNVRTMQQELETDNGPQILVASLLAVFSTGSLIVAAIGLYAVVAFHTARRTRDIGIRLALGASAPEILRDVLRDGMLVACGGASLGVALSLVAGGVFGSLLPVTPSDPAAYAGSIALVTAVSLAACAIPARRAARIDPVVALRQE